MRICPAHFVTLGPCLEIFPEMVYNRVLSEWGREERNVAVKWSLSQCTLSDKLFWSGLHLGKCYSWAAAEVTFCTIFHRIAGGGGGKQSFFWHWLLKTSRFCLNELTQCSLPWWMVSFPCTLPLFDTEQSHPPEPLSNCKSPFEASDLGWWMPSLCELEKRAALSYVLLNLHKNWFTLPLGGYIGMEAEICVIICYSLACWLCLTLKPLCDEK